MTAPLNRARPPRRPSDATLLAAAREGWGVSIRLGLLLLMCGGTPALALVIWWLVAA